MLENFGMNLFYKDPAASLEKLKAFGYSYVDYGSHFNFHTMSKAELAAVKAKTRELGLIPFSLHNPYCLLPAPEEKDCERKLKQLREVVDVAAFLGAGILTVHPGVPDRVDSDINALISYWNSTGFDAINRRSVELLSALCEYAKAAGMTVTIENLPLFTGSSGESHFYNTVEELLAIIRDLSLRGIENIGVCFDTGHANIGGINAPEGVLKAGSHLKQLHLNDNPGVVKPLSQGDLHLVCGEGRIHWNEIVAALKTIDYSGPVTFELGSRSGHSVDVLLESCIRSWRGFEGRVAPEEAMAFKRLDKDADK